MIRKGIIYMLVSTLAFSFMNVLVKGLSELNAMQILFCRALGALLILVPYMLHNGITVWGNQWRLLIVRGIFGTISIATFFFVLQRIPLGSSVSLRYLGPIFGAFFAVYFLKEKISKWQLVSFAIAFSGVLLMKGFDVRIDYISFALIMTSAVFLGLAIIMVRYLTAGEHFTTIILYFMATSALFSLCFYQQWRWPSMLEWIFLLGVSLLGIMGQVFFTIALKSEETSTIAPFKYTELIWALIFGYFMFGESYGWLPLSGILLIISGMMLNLIAKKGADTKDIT